MTLNCCASPTNSRGSGRRKEILKAGKAAGPLASVAEAAMVAAATAAKLHP